MSVSPHQNGSVRNRGGRDQPVDVTILIATRDRADSIGRTLEHLGDQEVDDLSWEIVVIDNGSSDHTLRVLAKAATRLPLVIVNEEIPGKNRALNAGLMRARGELLVFTDDDVAPAPDWIRALVDAAGRWPEDDIFGGSILPRLPESAPPWMRGMAFAHTRWAFGGYHPRQTEGMTSQTPLGANMAIRARAMPAGGFDETIGPSGARYAMGSEVELLLRLFRGGAQFIFVPSARVEHILEQRHVTRTALNARAFRCGRGNARLFPSASTFPVLGVPLYQLRRLVESSTRILASSVGSERERWIAAMEFHQARGNACEQLTITLESRRGLGGSPRRILPTWRVVVRAIRRRGLWNLLVGGVGWLFQSLFRVQQMRVFSAPIAASTISPDLPEDVTIRVYSGSEAGRDVCVAICRLESLDAEVIESRLAAGSSVAIAFTDMRAVAYAWCAYGDLEVIEIGRTLRVGQRDVVGFDGFVVPDWRGRGVLGALDRAQLTLAAEAGRHRQLVYAMGRNRSSTNALARMGKQEILRLWQVTVPPLGWSHPWASDDSLAVELLGRQSRA